MLNFNIYFNLAFKFILYQLKLHVKPLRYDEVVSMCIEFPTFCVKYTRYKIINIILQYKRFI